MVSLTRPFSISSRLASRPVSRVWISEPSIWVPARQVSILAASRPSAQSIAAMKHKCVLCHDLEATAQAAVKATTATGL